MQRITPVATASNLQESKSIETAVIIPSYNRKEYTLSCLSDLHQQTYLNFITILVDDGSTDGTPEAVSELFASVIVIRGNGQLWWTGAMNCGLQYAVSNYPELKYAIALNDDLTFDSGLLASLVEEAQRRQPALVGSVVLDRKGRILQGGLRINWWTAKWTNLYAGSFLSDFDPDHIEKVSTLTGRGVLIPLEALKRYGVYRRNHYMQCGDIELPCRLAKRGYSLYVSYKCRVTSVDVSEQQSDRKFRAGDLGSYLLDIKSNTNLRYRWWFAWDSAPALTKPTYILFDLCRILCHFWRCLKQY